MRTAEEILADIIREEVAKAYEDAAHIAFLHGAAPFVVAAIRSAKERRREEGAQVPS